MADAPQFKFWWQRVENTSVLQMQRDSWDSLVGTLGKPVLLDISATPLRRVAQASSVVASVAKQFSPATSRVSIIRYDPDDVPMPYNKDEYDVWVDLALHPQLGNMIAAASTSDNANFRAFCREHVFFVKRKPGAEHWLPEIPSWITSLIEKS
jgi:hypothetical protein